MKIVQEIPFQKRTFEVLDSKIIKVVIERFGNVNEFTVDPAILDPSPQRVKHVSPVWKFSVGFLACTIFVMILFGVEHQKDRSDWVAAIFLTLGLFASAIASAWKAWTDSTDQIVFYNRFNGGAVLGLFNNKPTSETLNQFVEQIKKNTPPLIVGGPAKDKTIAQE